jgi:hypothetical protein
MQSSPMESSLPERDSEEESVKVMTVTLVNEERLEGRSPLFSLIKMILAQV